MNNSNNNIYNNRKKTTVWIIHVTKWPDCTREDMGMAKI